MKSLLQICNNKTSLLELVPGDIFTYADPNFSRVKRKLCYESEHRNYNITEGRATHVGRIDRKINYHGYEEVTKKELELVMDLVLITSH